MLKGISDRAYANGVSTSVVFCDNNILEEEEAFNNMIERGVDAIVWQPMQQSGKYSTKHIEKIILRHKKLPIVSLGDVNLPKIFKVHGNSEEDAKNGAIRQLKIGCRKFAIIHSKLSIPAHIKASSAYKNELIKNGIPEKNILEVLLDDTDTKPDFSKIKDLQGIWFFYPIALYDALPELRKFCNLKALHIDVQSFLEDFAFVKWTKIQAGVPLLEEMFGSMQYHLIKRYDVAYAATDIAIASMDSPNITPFSKILQWEMPFNNNTPVENTFPWKK